MHWFRLRPTFEIFLADSRSVAIEKLRVFFSQIEQPQHFLLHGEYGELHLPSAEHRLWSPHLSFYVADREGVCLIHGRFAPRLEVWTFVWVIYLAMAFTAFYGFALAYCQWMLGESAWGFAVGLASLLAICLVNVVAQVGQQWSADQMTALRERLENILHSAGIQTLTVASPAISI